VTSAPALEDFRGTVLTPDGQGYDTARAIWNGSFDKRPALVARATGVADVVAAVNYARENGLLLAVRAGGHSLPGYSTCDEGLVLDLSQMQGVYLDPTARTARVQGGALMAQLDRETHVHGLGVTGGQITHTGVAGLTLGGGIGWLMRKHWLTCDNLISAEVVTASGQVVTASEQENADLFWGLRGGSGNFGVVTSFEFQLHPVGVVLGGAALYPVSKVAVTLEPARLAGSKRMSASQRRKIFLSRRAAE